MISLDVDVRCLLDPWEIGCFEEQTFKLVEIFATLRALCGSTAQCTKDRMKPISEFLNARDELN